MTRIYEGRRPVPPGIILENYTDDVDLGMLKRGKEAEVYLVERVAPGGSCLFAEKRYLPFEERTFKQNIGYRQHRSKSVMRRDGISQRQARGGSGLRRAKERGTDFGRRALYSEWIEAEWATLERLWQAGAPVPYPVEQRSDGFLMEYIGDREQAAPRLAQAPLEKAELPPLFEQFADGLRAFARAGIVHADLSPYNLLVWEGVLWFIDFPQAVPYLESDQATDFLYRDVNNVCSWFARRGLEVDAEAVFADAMSELFEFRMTDLFVARD